MSEGQNHQRTPFEHDAESNSEHDVYEPEPDAQDLIGTLVVIPDQALNVNRTSPEQLDKDGEPSDDDEPSDSQSSTTDTDTHQHQQQQSQQFASSMDHDSSTTEALHRATQQLASQYDSGRMQITPGEHQQALTIKHTIESTPDLDNLSDMMYAQLAIVGQGDLEWAVQNAYQLQKYKKRYAVLDTLEDSLRHIPDQVKDRFLLSVDLDLQHGGYIIAYDAPKFNMNLFKSHDSIRGVMQRTYYLSQLLCPDLKAVQAGTTSLLECEGYSFQVSMVFDRHVIRSVASGAWNVYPIKHRAVRFFNTSILFNAMISTIKPALREEFRSKIRVGCKFPCGRLDRIYNIPSEEVAVARLCQKLEELIRRRFDNERNFSLEDAFVETDSSGDVE